MVIELSEDEALVLFDLLFRYGGDGNDRQLLLAAARARIEERWGFWQVDVCFGLSVEQFLDAYSMLPT